MRLSAVGRHVLVSLDGHDTHLYNYIGYALGKAAEATIILEGDIDVRVVLQEAIIFFIVGFMLGGAFNKVLMEGF